MDAVDAKSESGSGEHQGIRNGDAGFTGFDVRGPYNAFGRIGHQHGGRIQRRHSIQEFGFRERGGEFDFGGVAAGREGDLVDAIGAGNDGEGGEGSVCGDELVYVRAGFGDAEEPEGGGEGMEESGLGIGGERVNGIEVWGCDFGDENGAGGSDGEVVVPGSLGGLVNEVGG